MKAIILNYYNISVDVATIPNKDYEDIERYLTQELGYSLDSISYMTIDDDMPIPIYNAGSDELNDEPLYIIR